MAVVDEIREWLEGVLEQGADRVELRIRNDDARVRAWLLPGRAANDTVKESPAPAKLAADIAKAAERDGKGQAGALVTYVVLAFGESDERYIDRLFVDVNGRGKGGGARGEEDFPPTLFGFAGQVLKQNAELHRLLIMSQEGRQDAQDRLIARQQERIDQHETKRALLLETWEKVASMQMDRDHHQLQMKLEEQRQEFLVRKLDMLAPVFLNRLLGGGPNKGTPFFGEEIVKQLLAKMEGAQVEALMRGQAVQWKPEQLMLFGELYMAYAAKQEAQPREGESGGHRVGDNGSNGVSSDPKGGEPS